MIGAFTHYFLWHYGRAIKEGFNLFRNVEWFLFNFFSIQILIHTFFNRFERLGEDKPSDNTISGISSTFLLNTIMRIVGMLVRSAVIVAGLLFIIIFALLYAVLAIGWLLFPLFIFSLIVIGISTII